MTRGILVDAGPLVTILHRDDRDHRLCVDTLRELRDPLLSTRMPVTEAMDLLEFSASGQAALLEMIERRALRVLGLDADDMPGIRALMKRYDDLPMDFADVTLVHVAMREKIDEVFTLDRRDLGVYRLGRGKSFTIFPAP